MINLLTRWEEMYLVAVLELGDNAYGVTVKKRVAEKTGKIVSYGGLYFALDQLVKKELVNKMPGAPEPKQGGRTKFFYTLTDKGREALRATLAHQKALWKGIDDLALE